MGHSSNNNLLRNWRFDVFNHLGRGGFITASLLRAVDRSARDAADKAGDEEDENGHTNENSARSHTTTVVVNPCLLEFANSPVSVVRASGAGVKQKHQALEKYAAQQQDDTAKSHGRIGQAKTTVREEQHQGSDTRQCQAGNLKSRSRIPWSVAGGFWAVGHTFGVGVSGNTVDCKHFCVEWVPVTASTSPRQEEQPTLRFQR